VKDLHFIVAAAKYLSGLSTLRFPSKAAFLPKKCAPPNESQTSADKGLARSSKLDRSALTPSTTSVTAAVNIKMAATK
jgi:hypothetical protein